MHNATRAEAERLLGIAEKLLQNRDLLGSREFAILAQETEPLLEGSDQILATIDVLIASEKRVNNQPDWYSILQIDHRSDDIELIKKQYRRFALLLHPDKSRFYFADHAFKLVADAWAILSDPIKKAHYDKGFSFFSRVDLSVPGWVQQQEKLPVRRTEPVPRPRPRPGPSPGPIARNQGYDPRDSAAAAREEVAAGENSRRRKTTFWTACPYCYRLYEYPKVYDGCCLKCPNCDRSFHGVEVPNLPPLVPGQEAYYCCWGFFPMGFVNGNTGSAEKETAPASEPELESEPAPESEPEPEPVPVQQAQPASSLPNWMPVPAQAQAQAQPQPLPQPQHASSLPNWMPVAAENGGNNAIPETAPMRMPMPMPAPSPTRVTRRSTAAVGVPNGVASGSAPRKRGRPRKYPLQS